MAKKSEKKISLESDNKKSLFFELFESEGFVTSIGERGTQVATKVVENGEIIALRYTQHKVIRFSFVDNKYKKDQHSIGKNTVEITFCFPQLIDYEMVLRIFMKSLNVVISYILLEREEVHKGYGVGINKKYRCNVFIEEEDHAIFSEECCDKIYEHYFSTRYGFKNFRKKYPI